jgi:hypothetical protein
MRAAQYFQMEKITEAVIVVIRRGAGDVTQDILPRRRLPDLDQIVVALVSKDIFAKFKHVSVLQAWRRASP